MSADWIERVGALRSVQPPINWGAIVEVQLRDGSIAKGRAGLFCWAFTFGDRDVMKYRVIRAVHVGYGDAP